MHIKRDIDPTMMHVDLDTVEACVLLSAFWEQSRNRIKAGDDPFAYDTYLVDTITGRTGAFLRGDPELLGHVEHTLASYSQHTTEVAIGAHRDIPEISWADERCVQGIRASTMAEQFGAAILAYTTNFHEQLDMFIDVEAIGDGRLVLDPKDGVPEMPSV